MSTPVSHICMHTSGPPQRRALRWPCMLRSVRDLHQQPSHRSTRLQALINKRDLDIGFVQTVEDVYFLIPTEEDVQKPDLSLQVFPNRLDLKVKGDTLLSGDFPEAVDVDGCFWVFEEPPQGGRFILLTLAKKVMGHESWPWPFEQQSGANGASTSGHAGDVSGEPPAALTHFTFFDITIDDEPAGRLVFGLHGNELKRTVENFRALCAGDRGISKTGVPLHYKGSPFHRIIPGFMAQGGDFTKGNGTGGVSVFGGKFKDEGFPFKHTRSGQLSMANSGPDTNGSQFFITLGPQPHLDGKHVVFGVVYSGFSVLQRIAQLGSQSGSVSKAVVIADCGQLTGEDNPLHPLNVGSD